MLKENTHKLVMDERLDEVGFEHAVGVGAIDSLDLLGLKEKAMTDKLPLIHLMEKVRDIAFYLPALKSIQRKQLEQDLKVERIYEQQSVYLTNLDVDHYFDMFKRQWMKYVDEKLQSTEETLGKAQEGIVLKKEIEKMIEPKASKI